MNYQQVFQRFSELAQISTADAEKYRWLCNNAIDELKEMLVNNVDFSKCNSRLSAVASAMAFYKYTIIADNNNVTMFKAGEITVNYKQKCEFAENYLKQCMKSIKPYLKDNNFVFKGVRVNDIPNNL